VLKSPDSASRGFFPFVLTPTPSWRRIRAITSLKEAALVSEAWYVSPTPLRGRPVLVGKKVLLIDRNQPTRDVWARVLQSHGVEVHTAEDLSGARQLESYF